MSQAKLSVSACLEYVMVTIVSFSMFGICHNQNPQFHQSLRMSHNVKNSQTFTPKLFLGATTSHLVKSVHLLLVPDALQYRCAEEVALAKWHLLICA
jgi:hypothetical protein